MKFNLLSILALISTSHGWLPSEENREPLLGRDGTSLFNNSLSSERKRWLPGSTPIRGVNLGSLFVSEPWMMTPTWNGMNCPQSEPRSEFDCMLKLGQTGGDAAFQKHYQDWIPESDFDKMVSYGLNTVRIPVGYWMYEDIVYRDSEHFPRGGLAHLKRICGYASNRGFYIILDLHGAPGAQVANNAFTGQYTPNPGFYQDYQFDRAYKFLAWLRQVVHENTEFRNVGMFEVVNEPLREFEDSGKTTYMRNTFYPTAYKTIRDKEASLGISSNNYVHIQFMNKLWNSGDPQQYLTNKNFAAYDDHRYLKWSGISQDKDTYLRTSCNDDRSGDAAHGWDWPVLVGEWSLSAPLDYTQEWNDYWRPDNNKDFYSRWFKAQVLAYEKHVAGWIFWSWKTELGSDYRWSYTAAVDAGVIPRDLNSIANSGACNGF
ncbi:unnamed protein product [Clonostachys chloroleuca]|uniref:glucan endo-1,6-beta-glucosidase n=1 Tax=Clonostachys chloroleuca TaxID=1926264 RepID=A0AA35MK67_9HYPO|nr:unnamed protein product [Clonostachys chloroleuca]